MTVVATPEILRALYEFQDEIRSGNTNKSQRRHDAVLTARLIEIRRDVHPRIHDDFGAHEN